MSPRQRPWSGPRPPVEVTVALLAIVMVASGCGSSAEPGAEMVATTVRSEPATGRGEPAPSSTPPATQPSTEPATGRGATVPGPSASTDAVTDEDTAARVVTGAQALVDGGLQPLLGRRVGLIANRASTVGDDQRLIDVLDEHPDVDLVALFAPEHGVEAVGDAGAPVLDGVDAATGVPIQSLYDDDRAPDPEVLAGLDVLVFDLQDAGARFYTYVSTLGLALQAAAEAGVPVLVLDRPNPHGGQRPDGPVLVDGQRSFVGLYPIPALPGLTMGELALAIEGERWLDGLERLELDVIPLGGWTRGHRWDDTGLVWSAPSPGLPTAELATLYPATVLLEATTVSFGRGTDRPFGQIGAPWLDGPALVSRLDGAELPGVAFEAATVLAEDGRTVPGVRLVVTDPASIRPLAVGVHVVSALLDQAGDETVIDRPEFFDHLAGTTTLRLDLLAGRPPAAIVDSWADDLARWERTVAPYLLYDDGPG